jgi:hypothetical protein
MIDCRACRGEGNCCVIDHLRSRTLFRSPKAWLDCEVPAFGVGYRKHAVQLANS